MTYPYVIECRKSDGTLDFAAPQPEEFFGRRAINSIYSNEMATAILERIPDAELRGDNISDWPRLIDPRWVARQKTW